MIIGLARGCLHRQGRLVVLVEGQDGGGDVHLHPIDWQAGGQPAPALHIGGDLQDALGHRRIERGQGGFAHLAVRHQAMAGLEGLQGLDGGGIVEIRVSGRRRRRRDAFRRQARAQGRRAGIRRSRLHGLAAGQALPAALGRDGAVVGQGLHQLLVAGVGWRQGRQPLGELVLGRSGLEIGRGIVGGGTQAPFVIEIRSVQAAAAHRRGVMQDHRFQKGFALLAHRRIGRLQQGVEARRGEGLVGEALGGRLIESLAQQGDLFRLQDGGPSGGGRRGGRRGGRGLGQPGLRTEPQGQDQGNRGHRPDHRNHFGLRHPVAGRDYSTCRYDSGS